MDISESEAIRALMSLYPPTKPDGWVYSDALARAWGIEIEAARMRLERLVRQGKAEKVKCVDGGRVRWAYRVKEKPP